MNTYNKHKFTFKSTIEFSFLLVNVDAENFEARRIWDYNNYTRVDFDLRLASTTNTRQEGFKNPVVVDNKKILIILLRNLQILI
jgi:hypothetical protein